MDGRKAQEGSEFPKFKLRHYPVFSAPEILRVPWNNARFGQPVDKPFRRYDPGKRLRAAGRVWSYAKLIVTKPGAMARRALNFKKGF